ncbi:hypothetical protein OE09_2027 [Flavobacteriaceae bacterium MAR_2010_72]|nr:hypothetical protein OE09_2027 [Flavobacteriaceae bacterium MAR_2010_72]
MSKVEKLEEQLNKHLELLKERNVNLRNLVESFDDNRVDNDGRFQILKAIIISLIDDTEKLYENQFSSKIYLEEVLETLTRK